MQRLLCYAHYDAHGELKLFVKHALSAMREQCTEVVFVSNSPLVDDDIEYLQSICSNIIINDNRGYDFYMWKLALESVDHTNFDEVVLLNSSVYGPIFSLVPLFEKMEKSTCDFWGVTECFQIKPHIQSYFLVFKKNVVNSAAFQQFWSGVLPSNNKRQVILSYEVGLTQWLIEAGFKPEACFNFSQIAEYCQTIGKKVNLACNYSIFHTIDLLRIGNPFLKVEPIKSKRINITDISEYLENNMYPISHIIKPEPSSVTCPVCNSLGKLKYRRVRDVLNLYVDERFRYYKCCNKTCGAFFVWPKPSNEIVKIMYANYYTVSNQSMSESFSNKRAGAFKSLVLSGLKLLSKLFKLNRKRQKYYLHELTKVPPGKLLEMGCGSGNRLVELKKVGWDVVGQDIDYNAYESLTKNNISFIHGSTSQISDSQFDVILLSHVIEHIEDPLPFLEECHRLLKPKGKIYLSTPNNKSFTHMVFRKHWRGLEAPRHYIIYNNNSLSILLKKANFAIESQKTVCLNAESFAKHSIDIMCNKWTHVDCLPYNNMQVISSFYQLFISILDFIVTVQGDECFIVASK